MARKIHGAPGFVSIPSSDDPNIRLGQGTVAPEFFEQMEEIGEEILYSTIVRYGGESLLAGVGVTCAGIRVKVFGCEP